MKKFLVSLVVFAGLAQIAFAAPTLGSIQQSIPVGKNLSVGLGTSSSGKWFVMKNTNPEVAGSVIFTNSLVVNGLAVGITNISVCSELEATNCLEVSVTVVGSVLGLHTQTHPEGSWVNLGKTVFYVHSTGLIPIPTWSIFLSNGGKASLIVPANEADLNLPLLPLMVANDSRV